MAVKLVDLTQEQQCGEVTKSFHKPQPSTVPNHKKDPPKNPSETYWHWFFLRQTVLEGHENQLLFLFLSLQNGLIESR